MGDQLSATLTNDGVGEELSSEMVWACGKTDMSSACGDSSLAALVLASSEAIKESGAFLRSGDSWTTGSASDST